ncbi:acyltransferase [Flavobacterium sp. SM15]|uniref:acyltransferase family protein n=1 Tax=Flavobacterium sp. SM15 TaxID=2908005 RepID=UPI001EDC3175|nr:acyltransferase [Flavobacterium sp. SM15]MCG2611045.1 acyltransferase [Flavobacterium sp. SM15]
MDFLTLSIIFIGLFGILFCSVYIINLILPVSLEDIKYKSIDGLRGYLAFFVFLHHSYIWYFFLHGNAWEEPKSNLFNQFGQTSVLYFFMITSFLFTRKLIEAKDQINWKRLFLSRFLRIFPMYFVSILTLLCIVAYESDFTINDKISHIIRDTFKWLNFTISGAPNLNNVNNTYLINAGVAWSLPFEWMFYFLLPILALGFKIKPSKKVRTITLVVLIYMILENKPNLKLFLPFASGIVAALLYDYKNRFQNYSQSISLIILVLSVVSVIFFNHGKDFIPVLISTIIFIFITFGNSFFGILHWPISRKLGQITYSIYLVHGIILFIAFNYIIGIVEVSKFSVFNYWKTIAICIFPILFLCQVCYLYIEVPFIKMTEKIMARNSIK